MKKLLNTVIHDFITVTLTAIVTVFIISGVHGNNTVNNSTIKTVDAKSNDNSVNFKLVDSKPTFNIVYMKATGVMYTISTDPSNKGTVGTLWGEDGKPLTFEKFKYLKDKND